MEQAKTLNGTHHLTDETEHADTALLLIDVINPIEFEGGEKLLPHALLMADALVDLKRRAKESHIPIVYTNDNFGRWRSDFRTIVEQFLTPNVRGSRVVAKLCPEENDYFVLKPKHSAFFQTNLEILLRYLGVTKLILTGMAGDICVLFTANDAYMRDLRIIIPPDCIASEDADRNREALNLMRRVLKAETPLSKELKFNKATVNN